MKGYEAIILSSKPRVMELVTHIQAFAEMHQYTVEETYTACTMIKLTFDEVCKGLDSGKIVPMRSAKTRRKKK